VKVGDLVYDGRRRMNGIIVGTTTSHHIASMERWVVLYDDGQSGDAYNNEIKVINETI
jgi:hypothetical protein|tara:strand:+ start:219 stop:392 length:174 start_codon:yes stop_codon:yes gene_type:complete